MSGLDGLTGHPVLAAIDARRSVGRVRRDPVPRPLVERVLSDALRAPNHGLTHPWRFAVLAGDARAAAGEAHLRAVERAEGELTAERRAKERGRLERAPVVIACVVRGVEDPVTAREDRDAVAAGVQNLLLAAEALALAAMWRTGAMVDEPEVRDHLGLGPDDAVVGFVYLGRPSGPPHAATARPELADVAEWRGRWGTMQLRE